MRRVLVWLLTAVLTVSLAQSAFAGLRSPKENAPAEETPAEDAPAQDAEEEETPVDLCTEGSYHFFEEVGMMMWIPDFLQKYDLDFEEEPETYWIAFYEDEAQDRALAVYLFEYAGGDLNSYAEEIKGLGASEVNVIEENGLETVLYYYEENDAIVLTVEAEEGILCDFSFSPVSSGDYGDYIPWMLDSLMPADMEMDWDETLGMIRDNDKYAGDYTDIPETAMSFWVPEGMRRIDLDSLSGGESASEEESPAPEEAAEAAEEATEEETEEAPEEETEEASLRFSYCAEFGSEDSDMDVCVYGVESDIAFAELGGYLEEQGMLEPGYLVCNGMRAIAYNDARANALCLLVDSGTGLVEFDFFPQDADELQEAFYVMASSVVPMELEAFNPETAEALIGEYALAGELTDIEEIGGTLWVPEGFESLRLTDEDREEGYVRYYISEDEERAIAVQHFTGHTLSFAGLYELLLLGGVEQEAVRRTQLDGRPVFYYASGDTACFSTVLDDGSIVEYIYYPGEDEEMRRFRDITMGLVTFGE